MSRFLSALKRLPDNSLLQDVCALVAISAFIFVASFGLTEIAQLVETGRALP